MAGTVFGALFLYLLVTYIFLTMAKPIATRCSSGWTYCSIQWFEDNCAKKVVVVGLTHSGERMNINTINLNDLAHKILQEDLCKSHDIVHAHMDALKHIDCNGQIFLVAAFCKAIDEGNIAFCQQHLPDLFCTQSKHRACVGMHAVHKNMSLKHIEMLLEHDFNAYASEETLEKPLGSMEVLSLVAGRCAVQERWDVLDCIAARLEDEGDIKFLHLYCHDQNPATFRHSQIPLDAISVVCTALDPRTRADFYWPRTTCDALVAYGLQTIDDALRTSALNCDLLIFYKLCTHLYHQNTKHFISYIKQPEVVKAIQNPKNLYHIYNLIHLSFFRNTLYATQLLLEMVRAHATDTLPSGIVHNMVWRKFPMWVSLEHVSKNVATSCLPFAAAYNCKEIGMLLLDIGVDLSNSIDWEKIEGVASQFYGGETGGEIKWRVWQKRLDNWVSEYEKSVLEIEIQSTIGIDTQRKI